MGNYNWKEYGLWIVGFILGYLAIIGLGYLTTEIVKASIELERERVRGYVMEFVNEKR